MNKTLLKTCWTVHSIENRSKIKAIRVSEGGDGGRESGRSTGSLALDVGVDGLTSETDRCLADTDDDAEEGDVIALAESGGGVPREIGETGTDDAGVGSFQRCKETQFSRNEISQH